MKKPKAPKAPKPPKPKWENPPRRKGQTIRKPKNFV